MKSHYVCYGIKKALKSCNENLSSSVSSAYLDRQFVLNGVPLGK